MILHELGEGQAGRALDDAAWNEMLITCSAIAPSCMRAPCATIWRIVW